MEQVSPSAMPAASSQGRMVACGAVQGQGGEEADEHVQQPDSGLGQGHAVDRQEQSGQARQQR